jgi:hypothetical protein
MKSKHTHYIIMETPLIEITVFLWKQMLYYENHFWINLNRSMYRISVFSGDWKKVIFWHISFDWLGSEFHWFWRWFEYNYPEIILGWPIKNVGRKMLPYPQSSEKIDWKKSYSVCPSIDAGYTVDVCAAYGTDYKKRGQFIFLGKTIKMMKKIVETKPDSRAEVFTQNRF